MLTKLAATGGAATLFVDDVFSAYTYTGNGSTQTINNGIDLAGKGGLVWIKARTYNDPHSIFDTARGNNNPLSSSDAGAATGYTDLLTGYTSSGFTLGADASTIARANGSGYNFASWTFRKAPKFFDVVTYTGNASNRTIAHSLGSVPGMMIIKSTTDASAWRIYHRGLTSAQYVLGFSTGAQTLQSSMFNSTDPTASVFSVGTDISVNDTGQSYVAYLFAHDTAADGIVQCGSFTTDGGGQASVTLGWEPQFVMCKAISGSGANTSWITFDSTRNMAAAGGYSAWLYPNLTSAEATSAAYGIRPNATGMTPLQEASTTYVYVAIRRPQKAPTSGTQVFGAVAYSGGASQSLTVSGLGAPDVFWVKWRSGSPGSSSHNIWDRLRGTQAGRLYSDRTDGEQQTSSIDSFNMNGVSLNTSYANTSGTTYAGWFFKRALGVFEAVCDSGTGAAHTISHNLGATPELMIRKGRSGATDWQVYASSMANTDKLVLNTTAAKVTDATAWNSTSPTAAVFTVGTGANVNTSGGTYSTYLFATKAGISKVFSYTGNGSSQTVNCGFTTGARFILIKRTDAAGDWYVWDSTRGIVAGNDPYLSLNSTAAEVTSNDSVDPATTGFIVNQLAATNINVTSATYIGLALA